jgi:methyl-accepting chemotaxis protein
MFVLRHALTRRNIMNFHSPRIDPLRLASATIQAVDRIGEAAAEEINEAADEIVRGADEIAEKLRELAEAIKGHSKVAHEHISTFCDKATSMLDGIRTLQQGIGTLAQESKTPQMPEDIPAFLKGGPVVFEDFKI